MMQEVKGNPSCIPVLLFSIPSFLKSALTRMKMSIMFFLWMYFLSCNCIERTFFLLFFVSTLQLFLSPLSFISHFELKGLVKMFEWIPIFVGIEECLKRGNFVKRYTFLNFIKRIRQIHFFAFRTFWTWRIPRKGMSHYLHRHPKK